MGLTRMAAAQPEVETNAGFKKLMHTTLGDVH
jgi:hypothetical protein